MSLPKITIIIAVRNMKNKLAHAILSVLEQQYENLELLIFDGESTDGTVDIIKQHEQHITYWESSKDKGHCDACNKALERATGDLIMLLNADDELAPETLTEVAHAYRQHPSIDVISTGAKIVAIDSNGKKITLSEHVDPSTLQLTLYNVLFNPPLINARFFNRTLFQRLGKFKPIWIDGGYYISNDRYFMSNLALNGVTNHIIARPYYIYLSHAGSITFSKQHTMRINQEHLWLARQLLAEPKLTKENRGIVMQWLAKELAHQFLLLLLMRQFKTAALAAQDGIRQSGFAWLQQVVLAGWNGIRKKIVRG
jgi:glycosyltransferase involved in cell wall biosynthesis